MALDLTLCIVPKNIHSIFKKALKDNNYAEWIAFLPNIFKNKYFFDDIEDPSALNFKKDAYFLKEKYRYTSSDFFYDEMRCSSTLDYLFGEYSRERNKTFPFGFLWEKQSIFSEEIKSAQGLPVEIYEREKILQINDFLTGIDYELLKKYYNYEKVKKSKIYKLISPPFLNKMRESFLALKKLFHTAGQSKNLLVLKVID